MNRYIFKRITKVSIFLVSLLSFMLFIHVQNSFAENKYLIEPKEISDKESTLSFSFSGSDDNFAGIIAEVNGETYTEHYYSIKDGQVNTIEFYETFKAGTKINLYVVYYDESLKDNKTELAKTIIVQDKTAPKLSVPSFDARKNTIKISTESGAKVTATYNGKSVNVKKISNTARSITIKKPLVGKKLIVIAKDAAGNTKKITKTTSKPFVYLFTDDIQESDKYATGSVYDYKSTDKLYLVVGSKKYKGTIKKGKYKIKTPKLKTPRTVKIKLFDKYGNLLVAESARAYKYGEIKIGMTKKQILNSFYGKPDDISTDYYSNEYWEYWRYDFGSKTTFLNFRNGKLNNVSTY